MDYTTPTGLTMTEIFHGHFDAVPKGTAAITAWRWSHADREQKLVAVRIEDGEHEIKLLLDASEAIELGIALQVAANEADPQAMDRYLADAE